MPYGLVWHQSGQVPYLAISVKASSDCSLYYSIWIYIHIFCVTTYSAEVLKAAMPKSLSGSADASPVLQARSNIPSSSTLLVKKDAARNTLTPLGPLGLSLRDDDSAATNVRPRRQQPAADAGYSSDELQVLRLFVSQLCWWSVSIRLL